MPTPPPPPSPKRNTRSRNGSTSDGNIYQVVDFEKPSVIQIPGTYLLKSADSGCSISLFENVLPAKFVSKLQSDIRDSGTLQQYVTPTKRLLPRLASWYGPVDYNYSSVSMPAHSITDAPTITTAYKHICENFLAPNGIATNSDCFLINQYRTGKDSCGEHGDDEPIVDQASPIVTLSLGQERTMLIRESGNPGNAISVPLKSGSVLVMNGENFQTRFHHSIPKENSITVKCRISITFRTCTPLYLDKLGVSSSKLIDLAPPNPPLLISSFEHLSNHTVRTSLSPLASPSLPQNIKSAVISSSPVLNSPRSPSYLKSPSPSSNKSTASSQSRFPIPDIDSQPFALETLFESAESLKEPTLKAELKRHGLTTTGSSVDKRERLKRAIKACYHKISLQHLSLPSQPESVTASLEILDRSIVELKGIVSNQQTLIELLLNDTKTTNTKGPEAANLANDVQSLEKRLESVEGVLENIMRTSSESKNVSANNSTKIDDIALSSKHCLDILRTNATANIPPQPKQPPSGRRNPSHSPPRNRSPTQHRPPPPKQHRPRPLRNQSSEQATTPNTFPNSNTSSARKRKKVMLIHDSQLNNFSPDSFSPDIFEVEKFKAGKFCDLVNKHMRKIISAPNIDCYILQLGVNDYRYEKTPSTYSNGFLKAIQDAKASISSLLEKSSAKVLVSLPTPTPNQHEVLTTEFNECISAFITDTRLNKDYHRRLFTVSHLASFNRAIEVSCNNGEKPNPIQRDNIHVSDYGFKKLCLNIKSGLYRSFGISTRRVQTQPER